METSRSQFNTNSLVCLLLAVTAITSLHVDAQQERPLISRLLVVSTTSQPGSEAFRRFNQSVEAFGLELSVIVMKPSESELETLKRAVQPLKGEPELLVLVVDGAESVINGGQRDILERFGKFRPTTQIVFSSDVKCWPDQKLESSYPELESKAGDRFLSRVAFAGLAPKLWQLLNWPADDSLKTKQDQSQAFFTSVYLNPEARRELDIEIDHKSILFQNLDWLSTDVNLEFDLDGVRLRNGAHQSEPLVVHGRTSGRVMLNSLANYLGRAWTVRDGCRHCNESGFPLQNIQDSKLPRVVMAMFVEEPTPFLEHFLADALQLNYPHSRIHLFIHSAVEYHEHELENFLWRHGPEYASTRLLRGYLSSAAPVANESLEHEQEVTAEAEARQEALRWCRKLSCDYLFAIDSLARLELADTLRLLIEANRTVVAPGLNRPRKLWSNFWGSLTSEGFYARSYDYIELVRRDRTGLWNVPHLMNAYLVEGGFIRRSLERQEAGVGPFVLSYHDPNVALKPSLTFTALLRRANVFMYLLNTHEFGHLVDATTYNTSLAHPDFHQLQDNMHDWERKYLHQDYYNNLEPDMKLEQPCQDVFWFPLVNDLFCDTLISIMETFGQWSGGTNDDPRIEGGYESVPTRDIHMRQVGLHDMWLTFLQEYVMPIQLKEYIGYEHDPPRADLAFVVRYNPSEQPSLRPHHDSSTYTLNIALNRAGQDYTGGGCRFLRYNCSVTDTRRGWALFHPGRLTHYHEGLPVTNGTRYIMVTFVDP